MWKNNKWRFLSKMKIENLKIEELKAYEKNARKNKKAIEVVKRSIERFGFQNPILIDKDNVIIAGHTRLEAAKQLGHETVPTIRIGNLTETEIKAYRIMDNKSSQFSQWDMKKLKEELFELEEMNFDLEDTGFSAEETGNIFEEEKEQIHKVKKLGHHTIECPKCGEKFERAK